VNVPEEFQRWLAARALTVVPVAARELLDDAIDTRMERDRLRRELHELIRRESETPWADRLAMLNHEADLLRVVHAESEALIAALRRQQPADDLYRAWRQAVGRYERRTA
jgi:hypothetical protein